EVSSRVGTRRVGRGGPLVQAAEAEGCEGGRDGVAGDGLGEQAAEDRGEGHAVAAEAAREPDAGQVGCGVGDGRVVGGEGHQAGATPRDGQAGEGGEEAWQGRVDGGLHLRGGHHLPDADVTFWRYRPESTEDQGAGGGLLAVLAGGGEADA